MPQLFDIFSKQRKIENHPTKPIIKPKIIADYREKNSLVFSSLMKLGIEVDVTELKVGDFLVNGVVIERKTVSDFISSMLNKRLLRQLEDLKQHKNPLLIIEGIEERELYNEDPESGINPNAIRGFLLSIVLKHRIPIIFTKNSEDTAKFIAVIAKRKEKEMSLNISKKSLNKKEQIQFILEGFPGIGPATSKKLLKEFKTIKSLINTPIEDLKKIIGKKAEIFKILEENY
jgi:ERCC4-type nuclease